MKNILLLCSALIVLSACAGGKKGGGGGGGGIPGLGQRPVCAKCQKALEDERGGGDLLNRGFNSGAPGFADINNPSVSHANGITPGIIQPGQGSGAGIPEDSAPPAAPIEDPAPEGTSFVDNHPHRPPAEVVTAAGDPSTANRTVASTTGSVAETTNPATTTTP